MLHQQDTLFAGYLNNLKEKKICVNILKFS
jgi:hypothetical protein